MVQTRETGSTISCLRPALLDRAQVSVMLPREFDSDMRRDGSNAADVQPKPAVDERGRVHVVPDPDTFADLRGPAWNRAPVTVTEERLRWRRLTENGDQIRALDKSGASLLHLCGWGSSIFMYGLCASWPYAYGGTLAFFTQWRMAVPLFAPMRFLVPTNVTVWNTAIRGRADRHDKA